MSERPDELALRRALLAETDPDPGLEERMLAGHRRDTGRRRTPWALGAVAVLLAVAIVATLLVVRAERQRQTTPAAPPSSTPSAAPPPLSARAIVAAAFVSPQAGWVVESDRQRPLDAPATVYATTDGGAHWDRQLELAANQVTLQADPGGRALLGVQGTANGSFHSQLYATSDGGAHWQPVAQPPIPANDPFWTFHTKDAREAWLVRAPVGTPGGLEGSWTGWHTTDAGATWSRLPTLDYAATFGPDADGALVFEDATHGAFFCCYQGVGPNRAYATSDGGAHWRAVPIPPLPTGAAARLASLRPLPDGHLVAVVAGPAPGPSPPNLSNVPTAVTSAPRLPAPGPADAYVSEDFGAHWSGPRPLPASSYGYAITTGDADHWWAPAAGGALYATADQGRTWSRVAALPADPVATGSLLSFSGASLGWFPAMTAPAGRRNELLVTTDGGRTFQPVAPPEPIHVRVPCGGGPVEVVARVRLHVDLDTTPEPSPPAGLGQTAGCRYRIHAQGAGTLVIEATAAERGRTYTLGDLLDVWGIPDASYAVPVQYARVPAVAIEVDGSALGLGQDPRSVPLRNGTDITVRVTSPR